MLEFLSSGVKNVIYKHHVESTVDIFPGYALIMIFLGKGIKLGLNIGYQGIIKGYLRNSCKLKTRNAKAIYFKDSLSCDFYNPKQFWNKF